MKKNYGKNSIVLGVCLDKHSRSRIYLDENHFHYHDIDQSVSSMIVI